MNTAVVLIVYSYTALVNLADLVATLMNTKTRDGSWNSSHGFTKCGLEKISESIRAYSYLVLTSQASARHGILGEAAQSLTTQRLFLR